MAGGAALGVSSKSGIDDDVDAPSTAEGASHAARQRQRTSMRERRFGRRCFATAAGDGDIGAVGSIHPSLCLMLYGNQRARVMPFHGMFPLGQRAGLSTISSNSEADEKRPTGGWQKSLQQGVKVEAVAYSGAVQMI
jgi:hypothetical protein